MKEFFTFVVWFFVVLFISLLLGWIITGNRQGMIQELQNMQFQYEQADESHKQALAAIILHRSADFPEEDMPGDLRNFISSLRRVR